MWPTFPLLSGGAALHERNCFNLYTAAADVTRATADGIAIDSELQFATEANTTYWIYGLVQFQQVNGAGQPGAQMNFTHSGTTLAFQQMKGMSHGFVANGPTHGQDFYIVPVSLDGLGDAGYNSASTASTTTQLRVFVDCLLVVGTTPGTFGIQWGLSNLGVAGTTKRLLGSYISVQRVSA